MAACALRWKDMGTVSEDIPRPSPLTRQDEIRCPEVEYEIPYNWKYLLCYVVFLYVFICSKLLERVFLVWYLYHKILYYFHFILYSSRKDISDNNML